MLKHRALDELRLPFAATYMFDKLGQVQFVAKDRDQNLRFVRQLLLCATKPS